MLNITTNSIRGAFKLEDFKSHKQLKRSNIRKLPLIIIIVLIGIGFFAIFLPWTQNVRATGKVTTRSPQQRPQGIQAVISGRLDKWYVQEGDFVNRGDTIVFISEVSSDYFDPNLISRTSEQIDAKRLSISSYDQKVAAIEDQYAALLETKNLKLRQLANKIEQTKVKISADSLDLVATERNILLVKNQLQRTQELYTKGLKTLTELQDKKYKVQTAEAKYAIKKNKLLNLENDINNLVLEQKSVEKIYLDKISKSISDKQSALASKLESVASTAKLENQLINYSARRDFKYITAPQSGYITKTITKGIGEVIKQGNDVATIMPIDYTLAVEAYIKPRDLPLLSIHNEVKLRFDGWPAIVISGWPESSTGIFTGRIVAIDKFISDNGLYRILVSPDEVEKDWPGKLSIGTGSQVFILLKDVPIWYEIWRQLNGFPQEYYDIQEPEKESIKRKAPLKSVK